MQVRATFMTASVRMDCATKEKQSDKNSEWYKTFIKTFCIFLQFVYIPGPSLEEAGK